ncbi:MAG: TetR/AcrR family transcriptional regulator [Paracoccaceae bacterium]
MAMKRSVKKHVPPPPDPNLPARDRLIIAGGAVFSVQGYSGASVREICKLAGTGSNMIHHYFGSKQGLYDEILSGFSERLFVVPIRIISEPATNRENLMARLEIFLVETLEALIAQQELYRLVIREQIIFEVFETYNAQLVKFLDAAKEIGIVRAELDSEMLTGLILDRLGNQILFAPWISETSGQNIMSGGTFKKRWLKANLDLILHGILNSGNSG